MKRSEFISKIRNDIDELISDLAESFEDEKDKEEEIALLKKVTGSDAVLKQLSRDTEGRLVLLTIVESARALNTLIKEKGTEALEDMIEDQESLKNMFMPIVFKTASKAFVMEMGFENDVEDSFLDGVEMLTVLSEAKVELESLLEKQGKKGIDFSAILQNKANAGEIDANLGAFLEAFVVTDVNEDEESENDDEDDNGKIY